VDVQAVTWSVLIGDCRERMAAMPEASVDAIICDPPYGLEFMGKDWDSFGGEAWRSGAGFTKPGLGDRPTAWPSFGNGDSANATCATCGGRMRGAKKCGCEHPDWRVKGQALEERGNGKAEQMRAFQSWCEAWAVEALRVLKPGGHLLAFGGTRTYHRMACAIEDAGFEVRDCLAWLYGSGFPKSLDVSKAIDKAAGAAREVVGRSPWDARKPNGSAGVSSVGLSAAPGGGDITAPATPEAEAWQGWGTALKPAYEPVIVARKPLVGTVAANVLAHGTGALNIDATRIEHDGSGVWGDTQHPENHVAKPGSDGTTMGTGWHRPGASLRHDAGRWPANVILAAEAAAILDAQTGELKAPRSNGRTGQPQATCYGDRGADEQRPGRADDGGASRFFYCAKASRRERNAGLDGFSEKMPHDDAGHKHADGRAWDVPGSHSKPRANHHPTVKPVDVMRWLCRLVTPPGGVILDPFTGSGTTGIAALLEGFHFIGIEQDADYAAIAEARITLFAEHGDDALAEVRRLERSDAEREAHHARGQLDLFGGAA
jgi:DNA modification methylase